MHRVIPVDSDIRQTMHHQMLAVVAVTILAFITFPTTSTAYKAKSNGQEVVTEPLGDAKIIEIEHTSEPKTSYESGMYYYNQGQKGYVFNLCSFPFPDNLIY